MPPDLAYQWGMTSKGVWRLAGSAPLQRAMPNSYWGDVGLQGLGIDEHLENSDQLARFGRRRVTVVAGLPPSCPV
jgi:hypothetical protein